MTIPEQPPREWWIHSTGNAYTRNVSSQFPVVHVIEYSALEKAQAEIAENRLFLNQQNMRQLDIIKELQAERAKVAELEKQRDEYIDKYRLIDLANKNLSRNDHVAFGRLYEERDQLKSQVAILEKQIEERAAILNKDLLAENAELSAEVERLRVQLAGCGAIAMSNTHEALERSMPAKDAYGYSASLQDVANCVEREIRYRETLEGILNAGNMAAQGKWDATDEMKQVAFQALKREKGET